MFFNPARRERRLTEGAQLSQFIAEVSSEADRMISAIFSSAAHDDAVEALHRIVAAEADEADGLEMLQTFVETSVMSKWAALCSKLSDLRDMLNQELPDGVRGDGSERFSASCEDGFASSGEGVLSMFRRLDASHESKQPSDQDLAAFIAGGREDVSLIFDIEPVPSPGEVAVCLAGYADRVFEQLKQKQRLYGQQAPLVKHDRFVRLCHSFVAEDEPLAQTLALDVSNLSARPEASAETDPTT